ncbi:SprT family zinc-dependent metalloprotease [Kineobactrum salinum]|uniref:SprT family zinc-dependent metalloprotease n=1 Tax=Kineobactrum salinum TaxID=2708301 RepID=UPI001E49525A|nr:SprT-like domain-containing protein [Kineobactrum salinum]
MPDPIVPIDASQRLQVERATEHFVAEAARHLQLSLPPVAVVFDLSGTAAGMFSVQGRRCQIRYNPWIFALHFAENLRHTVPHEVAHYAVYRRWGQRRLRPHGPEWRWLMDCFGVPPRVTFDLDLAGVPVRRQRRYPYRCACREHAVSTVRHRRVLRGQASYRCRDCDSELTPVAERLASSD